jgi:hypothetical protein
MPDSRATLGTEGYSKHRSADGRSPALPSSMSKPAQFGRSSKYGLSPYLWGWDPKLSFQAELCPSRLRFDSIGGSAAGEIESKTRGKAARRGNDKLDHGY